MNYKKRIIGHGVVAAWFTIGALHGMANDMIWYGIASLLGAGMFIAEMFTVRGQQQTEDLLRKCLRDERERASVAEAELFRLRRLGIHNNGRHRG